jgi:hypothetical protein
MTEQTSFGGLAVAANPSSVTPSVDMAEDTGDDNKRKLAIVGAAVAVVVVLIAAFFLMKGKSAPAQPAPPNALANVGTTATPQGAAAAPAKAAKPVSLPKHFKGAIGRDPFKALYVEPVEKTSTPGSTTSGSTGSTTSTNTVVPPTTSSPGTTTPGTTTTGTDSPTTTTPVFRPVWIKLVKLTSSAATFDVGFSDHKNLKVRHYKLNPPNAASPQIFARNFAFLRMSADSVMLQYGDGTPFVLDAQHPTMIVN